MGHKPTCALVPAQSQTVHTDRVEDLFLPLRVMQQLLLESERQDVAYLLEALLDPAYDGCLDVARIADAKEAAHA